MSLGKKIASLIFWALLVGWSIALSFTPGNPPEQANSTGEQTIYASLPAYSIHAESERPVVKPEPEPEISEAVEQPEVAAKGTSIAAKGTSIPEPAEPEPEPEIQTDQPSEMVYVTSYGEKYHRTSCRTISRSTPTGMSEQDAIVRGYEACKVCCP